MWCLSMFKTNKLILIIVIVLGVLLSGCTGGQDVTPIVKALPEVQQFMKEHPNAKITVTYWSKDEVAKSIQEISQQCDKSITPVVMYKATVSEGDLKIVSWIDAENKIVICSVTEGKQTASTSTATPIQTVTATPLVTPVVTATPLITITPRPEITPTGKSILVELDSKRGFIPNEQIIGVGDEIIWRNDGAEIVTLVSNLGLFEDLSLAYGEEFRYVFKQLAIYPFNLKETNFSSTVAVRKITAISIIEIRGFAFNPQTTTISRGTIVTWINRDNISYTITGGLYYIGSLTGNVGGMTFIIRPGDSYSYTFDDDRVGSFEYGHSIDDGRTIYPSMPHGKIIVTQIETTPTPPATATVEIIDFSFYPPEVVIAKGGTVTWKQKDYDKHTVTGAGFDSGELSQGQTFSHTFNEVGTYEYWCKLHPSMRGKVIVK